MFYYFFSSSEAQITLYKISYSIDQFWIYSLNTGHGTQGDVMAPGGPTTQLQTSALPCEHEAYHLIWLSLNIWRRQRHPNPVLLPGKSHGWRGLVGCSPWGREELDTTERLPFHALEKEMATHPSVLAWRIPGMGEPGGLPSMGSHRVRHDWSDLAAALI